MRQTTEIAELMELAYDIDVTCRSTYSGRGMYGAECFAVEGSHADFARFIAALPDDEQDAMANTARTDQMGLGMVWYWPSLKTKEGLL